MNFDKKQMFIIEIPYFFIKVMRGVVIRNFVIANKKGKW